MGNDADPSIFPARDNVDTFVATDAAPARDNVDTLPKPVHTVPCATLLENEKGSLSLSEVIFTSLPRKGQCGQVDRVAFFYRAAPQDWRITIAEEGGSVRDVAFASSLKKLWPFVNGVRAKYGLKVIDGRPFLEATSATVVGGAY